VVTVNVDVTVPLMVTGLGLKLPLAPGGNPLTLKLAEPVKPLRGARETGMVTLEPAMMHGGAVGVTEKS
jgi:hypothetical protein